MSRELVKRPASLPDRKVPGTRPRLSGEDMVLIARLHRTGRKIAEIARIISTPDRVVSPQTVGQWLRRAKQPQEDLHMTLASLRLGAVDAWDLAMKRGARDGRHAPAKDLLIATGTIRPDAAPSLVLVIGSGSPDPASLPALPTRTLQD